MKTPSPRAIARVWWFVAVAPAVAAAAFVAIVEPGSLIIVGFLLLAAAAYATVGALVAARQARNPIGWLFLAVGVCLGVASFTTHFAGYESGRLAGATAAGLIAVVAPGVVLPFALPTFLLLFPEGRLLSRRWRAAVAIAGLASLVMTLGLLASSTMGNLVTTPGWVAGIPGIRAFVIAGAALTGLATAAGFSSLAIRYRRAFSEDRQQLKWLMTMLAAMVGATALGVLASFLGDTAWIVVALVILVDGFGILIGIPGATAIAVLTYGLYDVGVVLKKGIVYGLLVATFALILGLILFFFSPLAMGTSGSADQGAFARITSGLLIAVLAFAATFRWLKRFARRAVYGRRATPYEVMAEFTERLGEAYSTDDVLPRTAEILRASTGAETTRVWLRIGEELRPAAASPTSDGPPPESRALTSEGGLPPLPGRAFPVRHQGELLGAFSVEMPASEPLSAPSERLAADLATQAGLVLRNVRLTEELKATIDELRASRQRIVSAQDERARKLERDLHDGAQQQLIALAVKLRLAEQLAPADERTRALLSEIHGDADDALQNLRDLARGIYPPLLADKGLPAAIDSQARKSPTAVTFDADGIGRYAQEVEAAVYFCCLEALQNAAKYASATSLTIRLAESDGVLAFSVADDGVGFDPLTMRLGAGLTNMRDRLEALGGTLEIASHPHTGTTLSGRVPAGDRR